MVFNARHTGTSWVSTDTLTFESTSGSYTTLYPVSSPILLKSVFKFTPDERRVIFLSKTAGSSGLELSALGLDTSSLALFSLRRLASGLVASFHSSTRIFVFVSWFNASKRFGQDSNIPDTKIKVAKRIILSSFFLF